jgi:hypothetical protein
MAIISRLAMDLFRCSDDRGCDLIIPIYSDKAELHDCSSAFQLIVFLAGRFQVERTG